MKTLVAPSHTLVDHIPLGRRIEEIKKEKGGWYTTAAMSKRIGLSEATFRDMLKTRRVIYTFELDKIAKDLKMSPTRILQEDIKIDTVCLVDLLQARKRPSDSLSLALELNSQAVGMSERCNANLRVGKAYFDCYNFNEAIKSLNEAYALSVEINLQHQETELMYQVSCLLMDSLVAVKDYVSASKIFEEITPYFVKTPSRQAAISYQKAMIEESKGNIPKAHSHAVDSLKFALETQNRILIARSQLNLSHFEYLQRNFKESQYLLEQAIVGLQEDLKTQLIARKELIKTLLKQSEQEKAYQQIELAISDAQSLDWIEMVGKLNILLARTTNQPEYAISILQDHNNNENIRYLASKCLQSYYKSINDGEGFLHYSMIAEGLSNHSPDFLDEGEL